jgi:hypothetical protein
MAEPLGTYGQTVGRSTIDPETGEILLTPPEALTPEKKRARKYDRARSMARLLQHKDLVGCHAWAQSKTSPVAVNVKRAVHRSGFFTGLQSCGLVHVCAHCQPKVAARRAHEVQAAIDAWTLQGGAVLLLTFTLSHGRADPLADTLGALKSAGRRVAQHRAFKALAPAVGLVGRIVATEYTHGANGWHPHQHQLWFVRSGLDLAAVKGALDPVWQASLLKSGFTASDAHGVRVDGGERAAQYVAKMSTGDTWGLADELVRSASKVGRNGSRSVWQILDTWADRLAPEADRGQAARLLREYAEVTKGTKALTWSPGLKKRFDLAEVADEVLAEEAQDETTALVAFIEPHDWPHVVRHRAQAEVLTAAEDGGAESVSWFVSLLVESPNRASWKQPTEDGPTASAPAPGADGPLLDSSTSAINVLR